MAGDTVARVQALASSPAPWEELCEPQLPRLHSGGISRTDLPVLQERETREPRAVTCPVPARPPHPVRAHDVDSQQTLVLGDWL